MAPSAAGAAGPTFEDLERDLQAVLMDQNHHGGGGGASADELSMYRSGSAPPTVQGARAALFSAPPQPQLDSLGGGGGGDMLSEEEILSHPAYLQYYYNNEHLNPRLPAPMVSKEDWRAAQRFQAVSGGIGDRRRRPSEAPGGGSSLFSVQPGAREGNGAEFLMSDRMGRSDRNGLARQQSSDWLAQGADGLIGLSDVNGIASRRKSFADALQENISRPGSKAGHLSRSDSRNAFESPNPINLSRSNSRNAFESPNPINLSRSNSRNAFESPNPINLSRSNSRNAFESPNPINLSRSNSRNAFESPNPVNLSRSNSRNAFESPNPIRSSDSSNGQLPSRPESMNGFRSGAASPSLVRVQSLGSSMSHTFSSAVGSSISRNTTPDPQLVQRIPSPCLPPVGVRMGKADRKVEGTGVASHNYDGSDTAAALSAMSNLNLSGNRMTNLETDVQNHIYQNFGDQRDVLFNAPKEHRQFSQQKLVHSADEEPMNALEYAAFPNGTSNMSNSNMSKLAAESKSNFPTQSPHGNANKKESLLSPNGSMYLYQNLNGDSPSGRHTKANSRSSGSSMVNNHLNTDGEYGNLLSSQGGTGFQGQTMDPMYASYLQANPNSPLGAAASMSPFRGSNFSGSGHLDHLDTAGYQKAYLASLLAQQKLQYGMQYLGKSGGLSPTLYGSEQAYGMEMSYLASPRSSPFISSPQGHARQGDRPTRIPSMARSTAVGTMGTWNSENGLIDRGYGSSLLEEFKTNKTRSFELLDIVGHVVEFSSDQYGSRFIQQKLETASTEEKDMIFPEILPQARTLMTDVFGNYVIQKFFEYGTESQQKQLASLLKGYVLTLSLQMYGCRVIQKALEVVEVEQQTQMALELDGTIMKCVRDQNGNHVIQKCIECIPQERIQFIISAFYGHVVDLSTHPYGCRVIQRVLEHCDDESTQSAMMEEIMQSVVPLTQDQYGNYVIQHVLQHGKPEERTSIIRQLAGQIVKMSQQKFASNVVEKCLSFGSREERQILIDEMLGTTDENEPLQAMMKDQFANYVVQKVLETCDDHNRELILSRIKVHLNALKRYTYGKHIVARVEKLIQAGERRIGVSSQSLRD